MLRAWEFIFYDVNTRIILVLDILKSIKQQDTPWKAKLKFAHQLMGDNCQFPSKNHLILEWACQELVFNSRHKCYTEEMCTELWNIITKMLQIIISEKSTSSLLLRPSFIEVMVNEIQSTRCPSVPFIMCCKILFSTPEYYRTTAMKYEKLVKFLRSALKLVPTMFQLVVQTVDIDQEEMTVHLKLYLELIDTLLRLYLKLQKQQANLQKVAVGFSEKLLQEIAEWKGVLLKWKEMTASQWENIHSKEILQQTLWNSDTISSMKGHAHLYGKDEKGGSHGNRNFALLDSLFAAIEACVINEMDSSRNAILQFVPELFQTFLAASSDSKSLPKHFEFTMFRKFCSAVLKSDFGSDVEATLAINCICQLLKALLDFRVFLVVDETVNTDRNRRFLHNLSEMIFGKIDRGSNELTIAILDCIGHLIEIDMSLLNNQLEDIFKLVIATESSLEEPLIAYKCQHSIKNAKNNLLGLILDTYSRTRRTGDFVKMLVSSILTCQESIDLSLIFVGKLENICMGLPVGQSLSIIKLLLEELTNNYVSRKTDLLHDSKAVTKLMALSEMLSLFVSNIHILPSNGYLGENQQRFLVMSETLREEVILPLIAVYQELTEKEKKMKLFGTVVRFVGLFQSLNLYFIDHGLVSSPLLHLCTAEAEWLLPVSPKSDTLIHCLSADDLSFYVQGIILYSRQLIISSDKKSYCNSIAHIEELVAYFVGCDEQSRNLQWHTQMGSIFLRELPWLGSFISKSCVSNLCNMFLNTITDIIANDGYKLMQNLQSMSKRPVSNKALSKHKGSYKEFSNIVSVPYFYDNVALQSEFCNCLVEKTRKIGIWPDISIPFERLMDLASLDEHTIDRMEIDDSSLVEQQFQSLNGVSEKDELVQKHDLDLTTAVNDIMEFILDGFTTGSGDERMEIPEDGIHIAPSLSYASECCKILEVVNMLIYEWLTPWAATKVLLLTLLIRKKSYLSESAFISMEMQRATFCLLEKFTGSTILANRLAVWRIADPVLLLQCVLCMITEYSKEEGVTQVPCAAYQCIRNLWLILFNTKRNKSNNEVFKKLKDDMLQLVDEVSNNLSLNSIELLNALLFSTLQVIQARVVKKRCLVTASHLTLPIIEQLLSLDLDVVFARYQVDKSHTDELNESQKIVYHILRCYGYVFSICLQMKSSGKDQNFMRLLNNVKLEDLINKTASTVQRELSQVTPDCTGTELFTIKEDACLEFLSVLYNHKACPETLQLQSKDFCELVCGSLISVLEKKCQNQSKPRNCRSYFEIIAHSFKTADCVAAYHIVQLVYRRLVLALQDGNLLRILLELLEYLFSTKCSREKKKSILSLLPKVLYVMLDITNKRAEEDILLATFKSLVALLAFSKDVLVPSLASMALSCILAPAKSRLDRNCPLELLHVKLKLLSVVLFNHTNAMIGAVASFRSALNSVLEEFSLLNKPMKIANEDILKACDGIARLYQEIASHKDVVSEFVRYFIADYLTMVKSCTIQKDCQKLLSSGIYCLMDICPAQDFSYLYTVLPQEERELLKDLHASFIKHHKFQGKA